MRDLLLIAALISVGFLPADDSAVANVANTGASTVATPAVIAEPILASTTVNTLDPVLARRLATETSRRLQEEFVNQPARFDLERAQVRSTGTYLAVLADGQADFGDEGRAVATVRALYDPAADRWLRVDYELGDGIASR